MNVSLRTKGWRELALVVLLVFLSPPAESSDRVRKSTILHMNRDGVTNTFEKYAVTAAACKPPAARTNTKALTVASSFLPAPMLFATCGAAQPANNQDCSISPGCSLGRRPASTLCLATHLAISVSVKPPHYKTGVVPCACGSRATFVNSVMSA